MFGFLTVFVLLLATQSAFGSPYLHLFSSSKTRAVAGLLRQKARRTLARQKFERVATLFKSKVVPLDEYQQFKNADTLSQLDLEIAEIRAHVATISLDLVLSQARNGKPIPLCRRKRQKDEDTVSKLLKRPNPPVVIPGPRLLPDMTGTKITPPEPPLPPEPPIEEPPPIEPPPEPVKPAPPVFDPPDPPAPPAPKPDPKPEPKPDPKPDPKPPK